MLEIMRRIARPLRFASGARHRAVFRSTTVVVGVVLLALCSAVNAQSQSSPPEWSNPTARPNDRLEREKRDPDLPAPPILPDQRSAVKRSPDRMFTAPLPGEVSAPRFTLPLASGILSSWAGDTYRNPDNSLWDIVSWGFNTAGPKALDSSQQMLEMTLERNYHDPTRGPQSEAYLQFWDPQGELLRPWQINVPYAGPYAFKTLMTVNVDWFSILDAKYERQKMKIKDAFVLAPDIPFFFSDTSGCAGCQYDVGLAPGQPGELTVVKYTPGCCFEVGDLVVGKLTVVEGTDKSVGQVTLQNGATTVTTKTVKSGSRIFLSYAGIVGQPGILYSSGIQDSASFEIRSTSLTDNSPVNYWIIN